MTTQAESVTVLDFADLDLNQEAQLVDVHGGVWPFRRAKIEEPQEGGFMGGIHVRRGSAKWLMRPRRGETGPIDPNEFVSLHRIPRTATAGQVFSIGGMPFKVREIILLKT